MGTVVSQLVSIPDILHEEVHAECHAEKLQFDKRNASRPFSACAEGQRSGKVYSQLYDLDVQNSMSKPELANYKTCTLSDAALCRSPKVKLCNQCNSSLASGNPLNLQQDMPMS